jgi:heme-degrading monooxygenase HmoA
VQIVHILLLQPKQETSAEALEAVITKIGALQQTIPGILSFESDKNLVTNNQGYTHGFVMTFESEEHLNAYVSHPTHQIVAKELRSLCSNVLIFDYPRA